MGKFIPNHIFPTSYIVYHSGFDITSDMVNMKMELNNWLLNAKIALERWGFWSSYYPYAEEILQLSYLM